MKMMNYCQDLVIRENCGLTKSEDDTCTSLMMIDGITLTK